MKQPPKKAPVIDPDFAALLSTPEKQTPAIDADFAAMHNAAQPATASRAATQQPSLWQRAKETASDIAVSGLGSIPGAATLYGFFTPAFTGGKRSMREGAQEFLAAQETARERSPTLANKLAPQNVAMAAVPYLPGFRQGTMLGRALYSAGVGAARAAERPAWQGESAADIAKQSAIGAGLEAGTGFLIGEPLGAIGRAMRTPARTAQAQAAKQATRAAEAPLYAQFENQGPLAIDPSVMSEPIIRRVLKMVKQDPELRQLPNTDPRVLDRVYKNIGRKAFEGQKWTPTKEAMKNARDLLGDEMDAASQTIPYSDALSAASRGRRVEAAGELGAEATRYAASGSPGTFKTAGRLSKDAVRQAQAQMLPAERQALAEGAYGFLREAPKTARLALGTRGAGIPIPVIPSRAAYQAPRIAELADMGPTLLQRALRGAVAGTPNLAGSELYRFLTGEY